MKTMSVKVPESLDRAVVTTAQTKSTVVREALEAFVRGKGGRRRLSFYDRAQDLAGTLPGPRDLSTNPKYLEDLGE